MSSNELAIIDAATAMPALLQHWRQLTSHIQPEARGGYIGNAKKALDAGLWDAAVNYFWTGTIEHLRSKVMAYGIEYFAAQVRDETLDSREKLERDVSDYRLIDGCYRLGIIGRHDNIQLQHCREVRNHFTSAHPTSQTVDPLEALNFIKNCVRHCLCIEVPPPGLNPKSLMENLRAEDITTRLDDVRVVLQRQSSKMLDTLVQVMFTEYVSLDCPGLLKANINGIAPIAWEGSTEECKDSIGQRYAKLVAEGTEEDMQEAIRFLRQVNGARYIPKQLRRSLVIKAARKLVDAHFGMNNFYNEPPHAEALADLGSDIPEGAETTYLKAILLCYLGNSYGYSYAAEPHTKAMLENLNQRCVNLLFVVLGNDEDILAELCNEKPVERLKEICRLVRGLNIPTAHKPYVNFFEHKSVAAIIQKFRAWAESS